MGSIRVIDSKPNQLSIEQVKALKQLAGRVVNQLELRLVSQRIQQEASAEAADRRELQQMVQQWKKLSCRKVRADIDSQQHSLKL